MLALAFFKFLLLVLVLRVHVLLRTRLPVLLKEPAKHPSIAVLGSFY
jgi:hypothetical protein